MSLFCINEVWRSSKASGDALIVLLVLADVYWEDGQLWQQVSREKLAELSRISEEERLDSILYDLLEASEISLEPDPDDGKLLPESGPFPFALSNRYLPKDRPIPTKNMPSSGYIYVLSIPTGAYKIGRTRTLSKRVLHIGQSSPHKVTLLHFFEARNPVAAESNLHLRFNRVRLNGEWFALRSPDVKWLLSLKGWDEGPII